MTRSRSVVLAALIVCSAVVGAVGPALAQTATDSGPVTYEATGSPMTVIVDTSDLNGGTEFTVEYTTQGGPSTETTVMARETYNTANLDQDQLLFFNEGAYESLNVTVSDYSGGEPKFETKHGLVGGLNLVRTVVGTTGGDSDLNCDTHEKIGNMVSGVKNLDCTAQPGTTTVNTTGLDQQDTEIELYQSAQNQKAASENYQTTLDNYLADTKTQARIIGKNAYIRSLNNGSSKAAAKTDAKQAVTEYYTTKQVNLLSQYEQSVSQWDYLRTQADTKGLQSGTDDYKQQNFVQGRTRDEEGRTWWTDTSDPAYSNHVNYEGTVTESVTLLNGTQTSVIAHKWHFSRDNSGTSGTRTATITDQYAQFNDLSGGGGWFAAGDRLAVEGYASDVDRVIVVNQTRYSEQWSNIQSQEQQVRNDMDTLAENTYSAYQSGEINNSDLVDPYVLANQQSAGDDFQGWTAAQLTLLGTNSPENFDQIGSFNVTTGDGTQYEGVLFSQENPASGQFENGTTYDTANIGGTQYVVTSDRIVELDGTFTIDRITTTSGETTENVTIQKTTYETTNVTELKQQYEDLAYKRAQIEAREQALQQSAGGGFLGDGKVSPIAALAIIGTLLAVVVLQN
ncbi:hypothetical protein AMS69_05670 [Haloarcula rubripromontorii]|uniref:Envelope protein N-terminal domain-containing protein n=1 Tax=Haloarcula rubripromontorii TaxID=1705562 RepID=A0A0N0BP50_9EURY|nr:hypothetical protein [Haloarcula rubripromontorii]KOX93413.1 hypothetical protein AMS69_05670 [Haloarcula rubripromontorii]